MIDEQGQDGDVAKEQLLGRKGTAAGTVYSWGINRHIIWGRARVSASTRDRWRFVGKRV